MELDGEWVVRRRERLPYDDNLYLAEAELRDEPGLAGILRRGLTAGPT